MITWPIDAKELRAIRRRHDKRRATHDDQAQLLAAIDALMERLTAVEMALYGQLGGTYAGADVTARIERERLST
jgi:hypothetical protein